MISKVTGPRENEMTTARHILSLLKSHIAGNALPRTRDAASRA